MPPIVPSPPAPQLAEALTLDLGDGVDLRFRLIPPGRFRMGARGEYQVEEPVHWVELTEPYYLGFYPVTQAQWRTLLERRPDLAGDLNRNPSEFKGDDRPVEQVSWDDCLRWCDVLTACLADGSIRSPSAAGALPLTATLPTEAQWEYACRSPTADDWATTDYHNGDGEAALAEIGWYEGNSDGETKPVGEFPQKGRDLHDPNDLCHMHGNVWEWCWDDWNENAYKLRRDGVRDPCFPPRTVRWQDRPDKDADRVVRGGSWGDSPRFCRAAYRGGWWSDVRGWDLGFRVCLLAPGPVPSQPARRVSSWLTSLAAGARRLAGAESSSDGSTSATQE